MAEGYGYTLIRFITDNPYFPYLNLLIFSGAWALHCHITWHMEAGLLMTVLVGGSKIGDMVTQAPPAWSNLCGA